MSKRNKSVVFFWFFTCIYVWNDIQLHINSESIYFNAKVGAYLSFVIYPLFGWLADARYGRYKVIKYSLHFLWLTAVSYCLFLVVLQLTSSRYHASLQFAAEVVSCAFSGLALGEFFMNITPFGIDQCPDGSSVELASSVRWMTTSWMLSDMFSGFIRGTLTHDDPTKNALVVSILLSVAVCLDHLCSHWLVKEPLFVNSTIHTVVKVTKFAFENKYPRLKSSYPYWKRGLWSRMDLAKSEYGGPSAADEVEDVKTFWRIMFPACLAIFFISLLILLNADHYKAKYNFKKVPDITLSLVENIGFVVNALLVLVIETLPCSRARHYIHSISILKRVAGGMILLLTAISGYACLQGAGFFLRENGVDFATNDTCFYDLTDYNSGSTAYPLNYQWEIIPNVVNSLGIFLVVTSTGEFICAQCPFSMRGFLLAVTFGLCGVFTAINYAFLLGVRIAIRKSPISTRVGCGVLYYCCALLTLVFLTAVFGCCYKLYRPRQRSHLQENEDNSTPVGYYADYAVSS